MNDKDKIEECKKITENIIKNAKELIELEDDFTEFFGAMKYNLRACGFLNYHILGVESEFTPRESIHFTDYYGTELAFNERDLNVDNLDPRDSIYLIDVESPLNDSEIERIKLFLGMDSHKSVFLDGKYIYGFFHTPNA